MFWILMILVVLGALYAYINSRPNTMHVERQILIQAPDDIIFILINDLKNWKRWSPYENLDPAMKKTFSGADSGVGAIYGWDGNNKAGAGCVEFARSMPNALIGIVLTMIRPFSATNQVEFRLQSQRHGTLVTWAMDATPNFISKAMSLVMDLDKLIGGQFDEGLANLKRVSEAV